MMLISEVTANNSSGFFYVDLVKCPKMWNFSPPYAMASSAEANTLSDNFSAIVVVKPPCRLYLHYLNEIQLWQPS